MSGSGGYRYCAADPDRLLAFRRIRPFGQYGHGFPFAALGGGVYRGRLAFRYRFGLGPDEIRVQGHGFGG